MGKVKVKKVDYEGQLEDVIGFTADDLEANRAGQLSAEQRAKLDYKQSRQLVGALVSGIPSIILVLTTLVLGFSTTLGFFTLVGCVVLAFVSLTNLNNGLCNYFDFKQNEARNIEGRLRLDVSSRSKGSVNYTVAIDEMIFTVDKEVFFTLKSGDPYTIYYLPRSKTILSVEWLRQ